MNRTLNLVIGASGSGKTTCLDIIREHHPEWSCHDFDDIGVPENADKRWRQEATEHWLQVLLEKDSNKPICLFGLIVLGELLCAPSSEHFSYINVVFLECSDVIRIQRLQQRGDQPTQDTLNWASWLRMHYHDPQWQQHVIIEASWSGMKWSRLQGLKRWPGNMKIRHVDTTAITDNEVAEIVSQSLLKSMSDE